MNTIAKARKQDRRNDRLIIAGIALSYLAIAAVFLLASFTIDEYTALPFSSGWLTVPVFGTALVLATRWLVARLED